MSRSEVHFGEINLNCSGGLGIQVVAPLFYSQIHLVNDVFFSYIVVNVIGSLVGAFYYNVPTIAFNGCMAKLYKHLRVH